MVVEVRLSTHYAFETNLQGLSVWTEDRQIEKRGRDIGREMERGDGKRHKEHIEREKSAGLCGESVFKRKAQRSEMRVRDLLVLK